MIANLLVKEEMSSVIGCDECIFKGASAQVGYVTFSKLIGLSGKSQNVIRVGLFTLVCFV